MLYVIGSFCLGIDNFPLSAFRDFSCLILSCLQTSVSILQPTIIGRDTDRVENIGRKRYASCAIGLYACCCGIQVDVPFAIFILGSVGKFDYAIDFCYE